MVHLHKEFTDTQVKELIERYLERKFIYNLSDRILIFNQVIHSKTIKPYPFTDGYGFILRLFPILLGGNTYRSLF